MSKRKIFFIQEDNMEATEAFRTVRKTLLSKMIKR